MLNIPAERIFLGFPATGTVLPWDPQIPLPSPPTIPISIPMPPFDIRVEQDPSKASLLPLLSL